MHRRFAAWLCEKPWQAALATVCLGLLGPQGLSPFAVLAGAVPALIVLRRDSASALGVAALGAVAAGGLLISAGQSWGITAASVLAVFAAPLALAVLLRRSGSLTLVFQVAVLSAGAFLCIIHVVLDDPAAVWVRLLSYTVQELAKVGLQLDEEVVIGSLARTMWGTYTALMLLMALGSLFVGRWWQSLLESPGGFGAEFRELRLGRVLGLVAIALVLAAVFVDVGLVDALAWVAMTGLAFQGLAAAHRRKAAGRMNRGWLAAIYVLLIMPLSAFLMVSVLAGWGLADNWQRLRTHGA